MDRRKAYNTSAFKRVQSNSSSFKCPKVESQTTVMQVFSNNIENFTALCGKNLSGNQTGRINNNFPLKKVVETEIGENNFSEMNNRNNVFSGIDNEENNVVMINKAGMLSTSSFSKDEIKIVDPNLESPFKMLEDLCVKKTNKIIELERL